MKDSQKRTIPLHDYGPALQNAVSWLGQKYLLAEPVQRRSEELKPFFSTARSWHPQPSGH
jgi:hypothetical protein